MDNDYYVYVYLDPRKPGIYNYGKYEFYYKPFYVGKGKGNRVHKGFDDPNNNPNKRNTINEIRMKGTSPFIVKLYEKLSENLSYELEKSFIKDIGLDKLTNRSKGSTNYKYQIEHYNLKTNKNLIVSVIARYSDFYFLSDNSYFHQTLFADLFERC